jgi:hypothetical protein
MAARNPSAWGVHITLTGKPSPLAAVFGARFRMASAFNGANFPGVAVRTADSYSAVLRCVLAYSTWESLRAATEVSARVDSADLAERSRGTRGFLDYLIGKTDVGVRKGVQRVAEGESDNVRYILAAVRHLHAHGAWTPSSAGFTTKRSIALLNDLAAESLEAVDAAFTTWVQTLAHTMKGKTR